MSKLWLLATLLALPALLAQPSLAKQRVLLYSRTAGFRHASIPDAIKAFEKLGDKHDVYMFNTEKESHFEDEDWVNGWDAMVFVSVSGTALSNKGAVNMMKYIENGGGFMGVHEACDAMYKSPWYGRLLGAYFNYHPYIQRFTLDVESHDHPSTSFLNNTWSVYDEVYTFNSDPRDLGKHVVLTADSSSYKDPTGPGVGALRKIEGRHPIAWYKEGGLLDEPNKKVGGGVDDKKSTPKNQRGSGGAGRAFYTALGHTHGCWEKDDMIQHVWGGLKWVLDSPSIRSNNASLPRSAPGTAYIASKNDTDSGSSSASAGRTSAAASGSSGTATAGVPGQFTSAAAGANAVPVAITLFLACFAAMMLALLP